MLMNTALSKSVESDREHIVIKPSVLYVGTPVVLVTSLNPDGTTNISPMSSAWTLFDRVVLGLTSTSKGRENAIRERQLVLNFPSPDLWQKIEADCSDDGSRSGSSPQGEDRIPVRIRQVRCRRLYAASCRACRSATHSGVPDSIRSRGRGVARTRWRMALGPA